MDTIQSCLRDRIKIQHDEILDNTLTILATNGWDKGEDASFGYIPLSIICTHFRVLLEEADVDLALVEEEWNDMID